MTVLELELDTLGTGTGESFRLRSGLHDSLELFLRTISRIFDRRFAGLYKRFGARTEYSSNCYTGIPLLKIWIKVNTTVAFSITY